MKSNGIEYASVNSCIIQCRYMETFRKTETDKYYLQIGRDQFLILAEKVDPEMLKLVMIEARLLVKGESDKILSGNAVNLL